MCFHTSNTKSAIENENRFDAKFLSEGIYEPYYHLAGYDKRYIYIITQEEPYDIRAAYWKLLPEYWNIHERLKYKAATWNARADNLLTSTTYRKPALDNRCLILADGFFEPHKKDNQSYPHYFKYDDHSLFAFAGVYTELDDDVYTCSIVTVEANDFVASIHNVKKKGTYRMPLILDEQHEFDWINNDLKEGDVKELLYSVNRKNLTAYPVSKDINYGDRRKNHKGILEPVFYPELQQNDLFS